MTLPLTTDARPVGTPSEVTPEKANPLANRVIFSCASTSVQSAPLKFFSAVYVVQGRMRRMFFQATDDAEAREFCAHWGSGLEGESTRPATAPEHLPEAYDQETARALLGGISKSTLYREIQDGKLDRLPGTRRILITRLSLEARSRWRPLRRCR